MLATTQQSVFFILIQAYNVEVKTLFLSLILSVYQLKQVSLHPSLSENKLNLHKFKRVMI